MADWPVPQAEKGDPEEGAGRRTALFAAYEEKENNNRGTTSPWKGLRFALEGPAVPEIASDKMVD
jgi:hypothetical protein